MLSLLQRSFFLSFFIYFRRFCPFSQKKKKRKRMFLLKLELLFTTFFFFYLINFSGQIDENDFYVWFVVIFTHTHARTKQKLKGVLKKREDLPENYLQSESP